LSKKKTEYEAFVSRYLGSGVRRDQETLHQISIDVPRTCLEETLFKNHFVGEAMVRVLYCHTIRRPASGYVQGMNDLSAPLFDVFLRDFCVDETKIKLSLGEFKQVEADVFWCLGKLLDTVQDLFTFNQAGLYRQIAALKGIVQRADSTTQS
jgi:hypothetical protein